MYKAAWTKEIAYEKERMEMHNKVITKKTGYKAGFLVVDSDLFPAS